MCAPEGSSGGGRVGPADPADIRRVKSEGEVVGPFWRRIRIGVEVGDDVATGHFEPGVAGHRQTAALDLLQPDLRVAAGDLGRRVSRGVVDHDDLEVGVVERAGVPQALGRACGRHCARR